MSSALLELLESRSWEQDELEQVFFDSFGVKVKSQGPLYQFKYDDRAAKHHLEVTRACRGAILLRKDRGWSYVARPFDKFFNLTEGHCPLFKKKKIADFGQDLKLVEKTDGSLLMLWWNPVSEGWSLSTTGSMETQRPTRRGNIRSDKTFEEIFYEVTELGEAQLSQLNREHTYLFELCSADNPVITQYAEEKAYLLGARHSQSGAYLPAEDEQLQGLVQTSGIVWPHRIPVAELDLDTREDLLLFVEQAARQDRYGHWPEGFVLYASGEPVAKLKNRTYLQCLHALGGNRDLAKKGVMEAVVGGSIDDIYGLLDADLQAYADRLTQKLAGMLEATRSFLKALSTEENMDVRTFALAVKDKIPGQFHGFFFQNKQGLLAGDLEGEAAFEQWLQLSAGRIRI